MKQLITIILFAGLFCSCAKKATVDPIEPETRSFTTATSTGVQSLEDARRSMIEDIVTRLDAEMFVLTNHVDVYAAGWIAKAEASLPEDYRTDSETNDVERMIYGIETNLAYFAEMRRRQLAFHRKRYTEELEELNP